MLLLLSCFSHVGLCDLMDIAHEALLSMGFSRQEYWSGLPCFPPEDLPKPGIKLSFLTSPALEGRFFTSGTTWEAHVIIIHLSKHAMHNTKSKPKGKLCMDFGWITVYGVGSFLVTNISLL